MRFAYIDSQGKEIPIPSLESLALRIELGAITDSTSFYDAAADRWAPAGEHEIFRSLTRELDDGSGGFVAPPPPSVPSPPAAPSEPAPSDPPPSEPAPSDSSGSEPPPAVPGAPAPQPGAPGGAARGRVPDPFEALDGPAHREAEPQAPPAEAEATAAGAGQGADDVFGGLDFGLTLDETDLEKRDEDREPAPSGDLLDGEDVPPGASPDLTFGELDRPEPDGPGTDGLDTAGLETDALPLEGPPPREKGTGGFDFEGFGGMLVDDDDDEEEDEDDEGPGGRDAAPERPAADPGTEDEPDFALEGVFDASYDFSDEESEGRGAGVTAAGMELEQPLSEMEADDAASWMRGNEPEAVDPERKARTAPRPERGEGGGGGGERPERPPRARPAPGRARPEGTRIPGVLLLGVVLVLVAGGGWLGWSLLGGRGGTVVVEEEVDPPVEIPVIAAELEPSMREIAGAARADWLAFLHDELPAEHALAAEPDREWLSGRYLGTAGSFDAIEDYWRGLDDYLTDVEARDEALFAAAYQSRLDSAGIGAPDAGTLLARARAGFRAARPDRRPVYRQLGAVVDAAMGLHAFLVANEDRIAYEPAAGGASRDPVLEAVPATPALGQEMWDQVDDITAALDALGALDRVTTERLLDLFVAKLEPIGIR